MKTTTFNQLNPSIGTRPDDDSQAFRKFFSGPFLVGAMRVLLLDIPLFLVLSTFAATCWVQYVHDEYITPQLDAMKWTFDRQDREITYYNRECFPEDISTREGSDLYLALDATPEDAYLHQIKHGFTMFQQVLSPETSSQLRQRILSLNPIHGKEYDVLENDNRYSFGLTTRDPSVAKAVKELANHKQLSEGIQKILGPDPALIEMTAITSSYGALGQNYHDDINPRISALRYARSFSPLFSVFVQLQNTTKELGATGVCPGTHFCSDGTTYDLCNDEGFQLVGSNGVWTAGDALLMNMNSLHRGTAHIDPNGEDRVMIVLTFSPKPRSIAESRQISQGSTLSLRWDMWGHTWKDLQRADRDMQWPWYILKTLGLYKKKRASWGYDFVSAINMRIANDPNYWNQYGLQDFIEKGSYKYLPKFLHPLPDEVDMDDSHAWHYYFRATLQHVYEYHKLVAAVSIALYVILNGIGSFGSFGGFTFAVRRLVAFGVLSYAIWSFARRHVDSTQWAKDIKHNRLYQNVFEHEEQFGVQTIGFTTLPTRNDVLIEHRFSSSEYLGMFKDFIHCGHPGNVRFRHLYKSFSKGAISFEPAVNFIFDSISRENGRWLNQGADGQWFLFPKDKTLEYIERVLIEDDSVLGSISNAIDQMKGELQFGLYKNTALSTQSAIPYLRHLEKMLFSRFPSSFTQRKYSLVRPLAAKPAFSRDGAALLTESWIEPSILPASFQRRKLQAHKRSQFTTRHHRRKTGGHSHNQRGKWLRSGAAVEAIVGGYWYSGTVKDIDALGLIDVLIADEEKVSLEMKDVRVFKPFEIGEFVEVSFMEDGRTSIESAEVVNVGADNIIDVKLGDGDYMENINPSSFRRVVDVLENYARAEVRETGYK